MYNLKRLSLLLVGRKAEEGRPWVAGEQFESSEVWHAHVPGQLVGQEVTVLLPLDQRFPVPHSRHVAAFVLLLCSFENGLQLPTILGVQFSLQDSAAIHRFVLENYLALAGQHFLQGSCLCELSLASVLSDVSLGELDIDFPHFYDPSDGEQQLMITVEGSALCQDIAVPFALHQQQEHLSIFFGLKLFDEKHFAFSAGSILVQFADEVPGLVNYQAVVGFVVGFYNQSCLIRQSGWLSFFGLFWLYLILEEQVAVVELQWFVGSRSDMFVDGVQFLVVYCYVSPFCSLEQSKSQVRIANIRRTN